MESTQSNKNMIVSEGAASCDAKYKVFEFAFEVR
jgi:hypothetical protein